MDPKSRLLQWQMMLQNQMQMSLGVLQANLPLKNTSSFFLILFDNDDSHDQPLSIVDQIIIFHKRIPAVFIDQTSSTPKLSRSGSLDPPIPLSLVTTVHVLEFELFSFNHR